jgi:hypothetical protein
MTTTLATDVRLTVGIDTHAEAHVTVALDQFGRRLESCTIPTTGAGYISTAPCSATS